MLQNASIARTHLSRGPGRMWPSQVQPTPSAVTGIALEESRSFVAAAGGRYTRGGMEGGSGPGWDTGSAQAVHVDSDWRAGLRASVGAPAAWVERRGDAAPKGRGCRRRSHRSCQRNGLQRAPYGIRTQRTMWIKQHARMSTAAAQDEAKHSSHGGSGAEEHLPAR